MNENLEMKLGNLVDVTRLNVKSIVETAKKDINNIDKEWLKKINTITKSGKTVSEVYKMAAKEKKNLELEKENFLKSSFEMQDVESFNNINKKLAQLNTVVDTYDLARISKEKEKEEIKYTRIKNEIANTIKSSLNQSIDIIVKQIDTLSAEASEKSQQLAEAFSRARTEEVNDIMITLNGLNEEITRLKNFVLTADKLLNHNASIVGEAIEKNLLKDVIETDFSYNILSMYYSILEAYNINMKKIDKSNDMEVINITTPAIESKVEEPVEISSEKSVTKEEIIEPKEAYNKSNSLEATEFFIDEEDNDRLELEATETFDEEDEEVEENDFSTIKKLIESKKEEDKNEEYENAEKALDVAENSLDREDLKTAISLIEKLKNLIDRQSLKTRVVEINKKIVDNMDIDEFLVYAEEKLNRGSELSDEELNKLLQLYQLEENEEDYIVKVTNAIKENNNLVEKNRQHKIVVNNDIQKFGALTLVTETLGKVVDKIRDTRVFKNKYLNKVMHAREIGNDDEEAKYVRLLCDQSIVSSPKLFVNKNKISKLNYKLHTIGLSDKDSKQLKRIRLSASDSLYNGLSKKSYSTREEALVLLKQYLDMISLNQGLTIDTNMIYIFINEIKEKDLISESEARVYKEEIDSIILYQYCSDCVYVVDEESMKRAVKYYDSEAYKDLKLPYIKRK